MLAWADWTSDLTSDVLDACDRLIRAIRDLIGESGSELKLRRASETSLSVTRSASATARSLKEGGT